MKIGDLVKLTEWINIPSWRPMKPESSLGIIILYEEALRHAPTAHVCVAFADGVRYVSGQDLEVIYESR
jgi:hypothetical protein